MSTCINPEAQLRWVVVLFVKIMGPISSRSLDLPSTLRTQSGGQYGRSYAIYIYIIISIYLLRYELNNCAIEVIRWQSLYKYQTIVDAINSEEKNSRLTVP